MAGRTVAGMVGRVWTCRRGPVHPVMEKVGGFVAAAGAARTTRRTAEMPDAAAAPAQILPTQTALTGQVAAVGRRPPGKQEALAVPELLF